MDGQRAERRSPQQRAVTTDEAIERRSCSSSPSAGTRSAARCASRGWIPDADGATVAVGLARGADQIGPDENGQWAPFPRALRRSVRRLARPPPRRRRRRTAPRHGDRPHPRHRAGRRFHGARRVPRRRRHRDPDRQRDRPAPLLRRGPPDRRGRREGRADPARSTHPDRPAPHLTGCSSTATGTAGRPVHTAPAGCTPTTAATGATAARRISTTSSCSAPATTGCSTSTAGRSAVILDATRIDRVPAPGRNRHHALSTTAARRVRCANDSW